jgi:hypothetical protein
MTQFESQTQAVNILLQGVELAQKRGAYSLQEASVLSDAVTFLVEGSEKAQTQDHSSEKANEE